MKVFMAFIFGLIYLMSTCFIMGSGIFAAVVINAFKEGLATGDNLLKWIWGTLKSE